MPIFNNQLAGASGQAGGYTIDQSIRFNDNDSAYLSRTSGATGDRQKWTFSTWVKRGTFYGGGGVGSNQRIFHDTGNTNFIMFGYNGNEDIFRVYLGADLRTTALFRDPSAWYHLVVAVDTTQATSSDRVKIYQNGVQITSFSATGYPSLNYNTIFNNSGTTYQISGQSVAEYFDGYISEFHWIDGQALVPTDFGETNADGVWVPKAYAGTYGTNGFYITGANSADLGEDFSGNGNDFTSSGLTSDDQRGDTPTANQSVFNLLDQNGTSNIGTFSDGNLTLATSSNDSLAATSIPVIEGGCYWEAKIDSAGDEMFGLWVSSTKPLRSASTSSPHTDAASCVIRVATNTVYNEGSGSSFSPATISANDVVMFAYKNGQFFYGKNGAWENSGDPVAETGELFTITGSSSKVIVPVFGRSGGGNVTYTLHMSEEDFTYTAPTGYVALSTANLTDSTITTSGSFTGNVSTNGPFVFLNGVPTAMTINGNAVTFGTDADKLANGFKVRSSSSSYNSSGTNTFVVSVTDGSFADNVTAQINP